MTTGTDAMVRGAEWEFHNATTGEVTIYVFDEAEAPDTMGRMAYLTNPKTGKQAKVSVRWLLGQSGYRSKWYPVQAGVSA